MDGWYILRGEAAVKDSHAMAQSFAETGLKRICEEVGDYVSLSFRDCGKTVKIRCCYPGVPAGAAKPSLIRFVQSKNLVNREQIEEKLKEESLEK